MKKTSKHDEYLQEVEKFSAYVNTKEKIIGIYSTIEDCKIAEKSVALKKMRNIFKYKIQMVIK